MSHKFLDDTNVYPVFEQMGREGMAQGVGANTFCDSGPIHRDLDGFLQSGFKHVMPAKRIRSGILAQLFGWKNSKFVLSYTNSDGISEPRGPDP